MDELGLLSTLGREFCAVLGDFIPDLCGQDAYEVFSSALEGEVSVYKLRSLSDADVEALRAACESSLECQSVTSDHIREIVRATVAHRSQGS